MTGRRRIVSFKDPKRDQYNTHASPERDVEARWERCDFSPLRVSHLHSHLQHGYSQMMPSRLAPSFLGPTIATMGTQPWGCLQISTGQNTDLPLAAWNSSWLLTRMEPPRVPSGTQREGMGIRNRGSGFSRPYHGFSFPKQHLGSQKQSRYQGLAKVRASRIQYSGPWSSIRDFPERLPRDVVTWWSLPYGIPKVSACELWQVGG